MKTDKPHIPLDKPSLDGNEKNEANLNPNAEQVAVRTQSKITDLEIKPDEIIEQNYEKFIKGEIDLDQTLDFGLNVNSFRALSKDGINQVQAITKSLEKQLSKLNKSIHLKTGIPHSRHLTNIENAMNVLDVICAKPKLLEDEEILGWYVGCCFHLGLEGN